MRVAALYDIHGNLPALEAVVQQVREAQVDQVVVGGDVLPGPMSGETLACLLQLDIPVQFILGNGEVAVLAEKSGAEAPHWYRTIPESARRVVRWQANQLSPEHERLLASWPKTLRVTIPGPGDVLFCHATPRDENEVFTRLTSEELLLPVFEGLGVPLVVCGSPEFRRGERVTGRLLRGHETGRQSQQQQPAEYLHEKPHHGDASLNCCVCFARTRRAEPARPRHTLRSLV